MAENITGQAGMKSPITELTSPNGSSLSQLRDTVLCYTPVNVLELVREPSMFSSLIIVLSTVSSFPVHESLS